MSAYRQVDHLTPQQVEQLHQLYQNEWWTRGRTLADAILDHPKLRSVQHLELYCKPDMVPLVSSSSAPASIARSRH